MQKILEHIPLSFVIFWRHCLTTVLKDSLCLQDLLNIIFFSEHQKHIKGVYYWSMLHESNIYNEFRGFFAKVLTHLELHQFFHVTKIIKKTLCLILYDRLTQSSAKFGSG